MVMRFKHNPAISLSLRPSDPSKGPNGEIFRQDITLDDPQAQLCRAFGRKAPAAGWPAGAYRGYVRLQRGQKVLALRHADITVAP